MAAVVWLCGPPCRPGKTALSIALACSSVRHDHRATGTAQGLVRRGRDDVGVGPTGDGCAPPATRPAMWAMSATRTAPTSWAMAANAGKSTVRGTAVPPQKMTLGRSFRAISRTSFMSTPAGLAPDRVVDSVEPGPGRRDAVAVREVAAHGERHAHDRLARLEEREVDGKVGRRAGVRLDVGVLDTEQRLGPVDRDRLDLVDDLLALVVALARVALGVLVREDAAGGLEHGGGHVVLAGDQPDGLALSVLLGIDQAGDLGVGAGQLGVAVAHAALLRSALGIGGRPGAQAYGYGYKVSLVAPRW